MSLQTLTPAMSKLYALGRLPKGQMNDGERKFADAYLEPLKYAGEILWWRFEGIKLRLAHNTSLSVDFPVMRSDGALQMIDFKGSPRVFTDDARAKMKVAAELYPFPFFVAYPRAKKLGGGYVLERIGA